MKKILAAAVATALLAGAAYAASPYAGWQARDIKALDPDRVADLLAGKGAGYALAAELNGYPGPRHVLDLARDLGLAPEQAAATQALFAEMEGEARPLGAELVEQERALEEMFRRGRIDEQALTAQTSAIGATEARLRATHLKYHLRMAAILSQDQRAAYDRLRGYASAGSAPMVHQPGHRHGQ